MAAIAVGDPSARALCLGLVVQQEDTTQGLDRRLKRHFSSANFTRGAASKSIPRLAAEGFVELVEEGSKPTLHRYKATSAGEAYFLDWLHQTELPPAVRDALQCKLEFFAIEDVATLIEAVQDQKEAFTAAADVAHEKLDIQKRARRRRRRGNGVDWRLELGIIKWKDAAKLANVMAERLEALHEDLEDLLMAYREAGEVDGG